MSDQNQQGTMQEPPAPPMVTKRALLGQLTVVIIVSVSALLILLLLMAWKTVRSEPSIHSIFFVGLLAISTLGSIALDISLFDLKRSQLPNDNQTKKPAYHPNLRIWGVGLITGIGATITYLIAAVTLSLLKVTGVTHETIYQYTLLLVVLIIAMGFTIWGIVRVCQGE
jgi:hypothetical protein